MNKIVIAILSFFAIVFGLAIIVFGFWISLSNKEVSLRTSIENHQRYNKPSHDTMWKILKEKYGVADKYAKDFERIYPQLIAGRNQDKELLAKFVQESNPNLDTSLYNDLMKAISSERKKFLEDQKKLIDLKNEHDRLLGQFPGNFLLSGRSRIDITVITSDSTEEVFKQGRDNNSLFKE